MPGTTYLYANAAPAQTTPDWPQTPRSQRLWEGRCLPINVHWEGRCLPINVHLDVPKVVQSLYQLTHLIQKQHSPHLRPFVEGEIQFVGYTD